MARQDVRYDRTVTAARYQRRREAVWHRTSRRTIVNVGAGVVAQELREISALVWQVIADPVSVDELVDDLAAVFDQPAPAIRGDVRDLLSWMVASGLAERT